MTTTELLIDAQRRKTHFKYVRKNLTAELLGYQAKVCMADTALREIETEIQKLAGVQPTKLRSEP